jgi:hypothetical protein
MGTATWEKCHPPKFNSKKGTEESTLLEIIIRRAIDASYRQNIHNPIGYTAGFTVDNPTCSGHC